MSFPVVYCDSDTVNNIFVSFKFCKGSETSGFVIFFLNIIIIFFERLWSVPIFVNMNISVEGLFYIDVVHYTICIFHFCVFLAKWYGIPGLIYGITV